MSAQKKKFDDMFNAMMNEIDPKSVTTNGPAARSKPTAAVVDEAIFANFDMDEFAPVGSKKQQPAAPHHNRPMNGLSAGKKDPLNDLFQDELFASILAAAANNSNNTTNGASGLQPVQTKSKPVVAAAKKNSISGGANRYDDLFSGLPSSGQKGGGVKDNNMDWLGGGGLEYEGSFLTRDEANSTKGGGGLRRSRFIPSGKRDGNSATGKNVGGGWTQTAFKINSGPGIGGNQTSPVMTATTGPSGGASYVPSFVPTTTSAATKAQTDKKSNICSVFWFRTRFLIKINIPNHVCNLNIY